MPMLPEVVAKTVKEAIAEVLELDAEEITSEARLLGDLGAESIDLLDIVFRLERAFKIQIPRSGLEKEAKKKAGRWVKRGFLTPEAIEALREGMPEIDPTEFTEGLRPKDIPTLFKVQTFINLALKHLDEQAPAS